MTKTSLKNDQKLNIKQVEQDATLELAPAIIVIFGITGDLSTRKLLPSLYMMTKAGLIHEKTRILGVTRRPVKLDGLMKKAKLGIRELDGRVNKQTLKSLTSKIEMYQMDASSPDGYPGLKNYLDKIEDKVGLCLARIFYLSIPPQVSTPIITHLGQQGLNRGCDKHKVPARLLMEKPFGFDVKTGQELVQTTTRWFHEKQIFRIDHYLAKETVQNIVTFRFRNPIFENIWNNHYISSVDIAADEQLDIEGRANFYEQTGALRDLIQSHLLHVMAVVMMDQPDDFLSADDIHKLRGDILDSIETVPADRVAERTIRGQYEGYRDEVGNPISHVETFAMLRLYSNAPKWRDVPITIRTGKALSQKQTAITIKFKPEVGDYSHTNQLVFYIQPNESIVVQLWVKKPGFKRVLQTAEMSFSYEQTFSERQPTAYERVLVDAIRGDGTLFATSREVMSAWRIIEPVIRAWADNSKGLEVYEKGSLGDSFRLQD